MAEPVKSPYGAKPSQLGKPVPGKEQEDDVAAFMANFDAPAVDVPQPSSSPVPSGTPSDDVSADDFVNSLDNEDSSFNDGSPSPDVAPSLPVESFDDRVARTGSEVNALKELLSDAKTRFQAQWGGNQTEVVGKLAEKYGSDNVRVKNDVIEIKKPGQTGFVRFDPIRAGGGVESAFEFVNDVLDLSRDVTEGSFEGGGRVAGGAAGGAIGLLGGPAAIATTPAGLAVGQAVGGAGGAVLGLNVGDWISENIMNVKRDPTRNAKAEAALTGGISLGMGAIFGVASGRIARWTAAQRAKKASVTAGEVLNAAKDVQTMADSLERNGIRLKQGKMVLSPAQIAGDMSPELKKLDYDLTTEDGVRDFFVQQGKMFDEGFDKLKQGMLNATGKAPDDIFKAAKRAGRTETQLEGKLIETYRDTALRFSNDKVLSSNRAKQELERIKQASGFQVVPGKFNYETGMKDPDKLVPPQLSQLQEMFPDATPSVLGRAKSLILDFNKTMDKNNGGLPLKETDRLYKDLRKFIDDNWDTNSGDAVAKSMLGLKNSLRDDWTEQIGNTLNQFDPDAVGGYLVSMKKYSDMKVASEILRSTLKKNDMSAAAFANEIFSPTSGKDKVRQMKTLLDDEESGLFDSLVNQKFMMMTEDSLNKKTGRMDWGKLNNQIDKLKRAEVWDQMVPVDQTKQLDQFLSLAKNIDSEFKFQERGIPAKGMVRKLSRFLILMPSKVSKIAKIGATENLAESVVNSIGKDKALVKWLNGEGLEMVLNDMSPMERSRVRRTIVPILELANTVASQPQIVVPTSVRRPGIIKTTQDEEAAPQEPQQ